MGKLSELSESELTDKIEDCLSKERSSWDVPAEGAMIDLQLTEYHNIKRFLEVLIYQNELTLRVLKDRP